MTLPAGDVPQVDLYESICEEHAYLDSKPPEPPPPRPARQPLACHLSKASAGDQQHHSNRCPPRTERPMADPFEGNKGTFAFMTSLLPRVHAIVAAHPPEASEEEESSEGEATAPSVEE